MSEAKTLRLSKVAKELNVGVTHLADFLNKGGHNVDSSPNAKINEEQYGALLKEFAKDLKVKEKSLELRNSISPREKVSIEDKLKEEKKERPDEIPSEVLIKDSSLSAAAETPAQPAAEIKTAEAPKAEPKPEPAPAPEPAAEIPVAEKESPKEPEAPKGPKIEEVSADADTAGLKVVGKIELKEERRGGKPVKGRKDKTETPAAKEKTAEAPKTEAPKKAEEKKEEAPAVTKEETPEPPAKIAASSEETTKTETQESPKAEEKPEEPKTPAKTEPDMIRGTVEKLEGPTILGKIVLPVETGRKGGNSASDARKKRKRIPQQGAQKVGPGTPAQQNRPGGGGQPGGQQQGQGQGQGNRGPQRGKGRGRLPEPKVELTEEQIQKQIKETLARLSERGKSKQVKIRREKRAGIRERLQEEAAEQEREKRNLKVTEFVSANELAQLMDVSVTEIISACMSLGLFVSINQRLDAETISIIAEEFGFDVSFVSAEISESIEEEPDLEEDLRSRPPVVTVMGHVDHGKTSLLDYVRKANVIAGEAGGITQHIGAYGVQLESGKHITFIDTPGHEAFTAMRARGAQITDVAIIVIAADDSVMPQTIEAINHAKAAGVPMVFAINKIDKPGANPEKIREALAQMNILVEDWGGTYQVQEISAKKGLNIDALLDKVLLEAEILDLKANPERRANGVVIEAQLDKGRGFLCTMLVQNGTLNVGDVVLAGPYSGRVKAMYNERGQKITEAGPAAPVRMLGLSGAPQAGDRFNVMEDEREARDIATKRLQLQREQGMRVKKHITLDEIGRRIAIGDFKQLNVIIKGDTDGSIEALTDALLKLSTESIQVNAIHKSVGAISESDVLLASASDAIIVGFQVRPNTSARKLAEKEEIDIRHYSVIYQAIEEIKSAMEGMLAPTVEEKITGNVEVRMVYTVTKVGTVAGSYVLDGKIFRNSKVRVIRDGIVVHTGKLSGLKRFKDDVKEVATGYECGITIDKFNDIKEGDIIEAYEEVEVKRKL